MTKYAAKITMKDYIYKITFYKNKNNTNKQ